jgi:hypothetical protein
LFKISDAIIINAHTPVKYNFNQKQQPFIEKIKYLISIRHRTAAARTAKRWATFNADH